MKNIVLIGMPTSGKSTVGVLLAKQLGFSFLDSDLLLQEKEGKLLHELIEEEGTEGFLRLEGSVNANIETDRTVIATGGSAVYSETAMKHLSSIGHIIYLKINFHTLKSRLGDYVHRGVVFPDGYTLEDIYRERTALYEAYADATVEEAEAAYGITETLEKVLAAAREYLKE